MKSPSRPAFLRCLNILYCYSPSCSSSENLLNVLHCDPIETPLHINARIDEKDMRTKKMTGIMPLFIQVISLAGDLKKKR